MPASRLTIKINGDTADFQKKLSDTEKATKKLQASFKNVAVKATVAFAGLSATMAGLIRIYRDQEVAEQKLTTVLQSTGGAAGMTKDALIKMANELQKVTLFGDETTIAAQALMLTFTKIGEDVFPDAILGAMNMSTALGTDLKSSTIMLGKALNDPILGITALTRAGVQFSEEQKNLIKSFVSVNKVAEAQKIILKELETQFGGQAKAAAEGTGRFIQLHGAIGDLGQKIGSGLVPALSDMANWLNIILLETLDKHGEEIAKVAGYVLLFSANLSILTGTLAAAAAGFYSLRIAVLAGKGAFLTFGKAAKMTLVGGVLAGAAAGLTEFQENFSANMDKIVLVWDESWSAIIGAGFTAVMTLRNMQKAMAEMLMGLITFQGATLKTGYENLKKSVFDGIKGISDISLNAWTTMGKGVTAIDKRVNESLKKSKKETFDKLTEIQKEWNLKSIEGWIAHRDQMKDLLSGEKANELLKNKEFHEMMVEATNEERTQILEDLAALQITKNELEDQDTLNRVKKRIKDQNDETKFEHKHKLKLVGGMKSYYKTMKLLDDSRFKEADKFANQFAAMASSSNKELRAIAKVGANVSIVANTAAAASSAMRGAIEFFGVPAGPVIGGVLAAAQVAFGVEQLHRLNAQKLADGGIVSGGIKGIDSVPAMLMPGELVIPQRDANDALNAIGASRDEEVFGNESTTQVIIGFDGEEASQVLTARQIENQALGISREEAA